MKKSALARDGIGPAPAPGLGARAIDCGEKTVLIGRRAQAEIHDAARPFDQRGVSEF